MIKPSHIVLRASAGTGKTFALTNRLIALLHRGAPPSSILATTFTRKAAGEILERVLKRLAAAASGGVGLEQLREHIGPELTRESCRDLLVRVTGSVHRLSVLTLDAFFMRVARCFALELGTPPGWEVLASEDAQAAKEEAIEAVLESADTQQGLEGIQALVEAINAGKVKSRIWGAFEAEVDRAYAAFLTAKDNPAAWEVLGPESTPLDEPALLAAVEALAKAPVPNTAKGEPNKNWTKAIEALRAAANAGDWSDFLQQGLVQKVAERDPSYSRVLIPEKFQRCLAPLIAHASALYFDERRRRNIGVRELMRAFHAEYQRRKLARGGLCFDDVPRLLLERPRPEETHDLYYRLDASLRHLLLDEFQDTSVVQFRVLRPILDELVSRADGSTSVFCVGDAKQSLYMWRDAEPRLLPTLAKAYSQFVEVPLDENWRSSRVILDTVNTVFKGLRANRAATSEPSAAEFAELFPLHREGIAPGKSPRPGEVRLLEGPSNSAEDADTGGDNENGDGDRDAAWIRFIASEAARLAQRAPAASIAVLVRENRPVARIIHELNRLGHRASQEGGSTLLDAPPVAAALSALHLAEHPSDEQALFHVAVSPLGEALGLGVEAGPLDAARFGSSVRSRLMLEGFAAVLASWQRAIGPHTDARGLARFEQLIELAQEADARGTASPADFVKAAHARTVEDPGEHPIRVLTIHRAKGLEFDAVVLPLKSRVWSLGARDMLVGRSDRLGPPDAVSLYVPAAFDPYSPRLDELRRETRSNAILEELCCLYVGMTRPRHALSMIVPPKPTRRVQKDEPPKLSLCVQDIIRCGLIPDDPDASRPELWRAATKGPWEVQFKERSGGRERVEVELRLSTNEPPPIHRLARASPSGLEGGATIDLASLLAPAPAAGRERGTLIHAWFELIEWLDDAEPGDDALRDAARRCMAVGPEVDGAIAEFRRVCSGAVGAMLRRAEYASRPADTLRVLREHPFAVRDTDEEGSPRILGGQFDRVVLGFRAGRPTWGDVLDFKTDAVETDAEIARRAEHYAPQARAYVRALRRMFGLPADAVSARLLFTGPGVGVTVPDAAGADF